MDFIHNADYYTTTSTVCQQRSPKWRFGGAIKVFYVNITVTGVRLAETPKPFIFQRLYLHFELRVFLNSFKKVSFESNDGFASSMNTFAKLTETDRVRIAEVTLHSFAGPTNVNIVGFTFLNVDYGGHRESRTVSDV